MKNIYRLIAKDIIMIKYWVLAAWVVFLAEKTGLLGMFGDFSIFLPWIPAILAGSRLIQLDHPADKEAFVAQKPIPPWIWAVARYGALLLILPLPILIWNTALNLIVPHPLESLSDGFSKAFAQFHIFFLFLSPALMTRKPFAALGLAALFYFSVPIYLLFIWPKLILHSYAEASYPPDHMYVMAHLGFLAALVIGAHSRSITGIRTALVAALALGLCVSLFVPKWYLPVPDSRADFRTQAHEAFLDRPLHMEMKSGETTNVFFSNNEAGRISFISRQLANIKDIPPNSLLVQESLNARAWRADGSQFTGKHLLAPQKLSTVFPSRSWTGGIPSDRMDHIFIKPDEYAPAEGYLELIRWKDGEPPARVEGTAVFRLEAFVPVQSVPLKAGEQIWVRNRRMILGEPTLEEGVLRIDLHAVSISRNINVQNMMALTVEGNQYGRSVEFSRSPTADLRISVHPSDETSLPTPRELSEKGRLALYARVIVGRTSWSYDVDTSQFPDRSERMGAEREN